MWEWLVEKKDILESLFYIFSIAGLGIWGYILAKGTKLFKVLISYCKRFINRIHEKIIGKENIELLEELKILKGNKRAIKFLKDFKCEDDYTGINGGYEALEAFMNLYSCELDFNKIKNAYEKDKEESKYVGYHTERNVGEARIEVLKELIKKYSENYKGNDKGNNKQLDEQLKKEIKEIINTIIQKSK